VAQSKGLKAVIAANYLEIFDDINRFAPVALILDVKSKAPSNWKVMSLLRSDLIYRHIPIHVISSEENRSRARKWGAKSFMVRQDDRKSLDRLFEDIIALVTKQRSKF